MIDLALSSRLDRIITLLEARESSPKSDTSHVSNGFDWVRQLELAFSMISGAEVKVDKYFYSNAKQIVISIQTECMDCKTVTAVSDLFRQVFEEKIVQDVSHSTLHKKVGVA